MLQLQRIWLDLARSNAIEVGTLLDRAAQTLRELRPPGARAGAVTDEPVRGSNFGTQQPRTLLFLRLGIFDDKASVISLAGQLQFLTVLAACASNQVTLEYKLTTQRSATGDLVPYFDVRLWTHEPDEGMAEDLSEGLGRAIKTTLRDPFTLSILDEADVLSEPAHKATVTVPDGTVPLIREDWAPLIDYLRSLDQPSSVTLRVVPTGRDASTQTETPEEPRGFVSELEQTAANFFFRIAAQRPQPVMGLSLEIELGGDEPLGPVVTHSILTTLFGPVAPEVIAGGQLGAHPASLTPEQVLRIFHPPFGHLAGRGLTDRQRGVVMPAVPPLADGVDLGTAEASTGRGNVTVPARLSARSSNAAPLRDGTYRFREDEPAQESRPTGYRRWLGSSCGRSPR